MNQIFIGGTGRCGTTILKRVLTCHTKVISLNNELRVIIDPDGALNLISTLSERWSPYNADIALQRFQKLMLECGRTKFRITNLLEKVERKLFWSLYTTSRRYLGMGFSQFYGYSYYHQRLKQLIGQLTHHIASGCHDASPQYNLRSKIFEAEPVPRKKIVEIISQFFDDLYENASGDKEHTHWLDDTPYNLLHAHELLEIFPKMRFIHIYRDPRDVIASHRELRWGGDSFVSIARRVAGIYNRWFEIREKLPSDCFLEVSLETLASSPVHTLNEICDFIGLEFEEGLTKIALNKVHSGRWKKDIPKADWELAKPYIIQFIKAYDYEIDNN